MYTKRLLFGAIFFALCGCNSMSYTDRGVLGGGALGAITGAAIGSATGHTGAGAALGGIGGAIAGGAIGSGIEQAKHEARAEAVHDMQLRQAAIAAQKPRVSMHDVVQMSQQGVSEQLIINHIRQSGSNFQLSTQDIIFLKQNGVSDAVVREMQTRHYQPQPAAGPPVVVSPTPLVHRQVTVIHERPPPRVHFGIGYVHHRHCRPFRHCWP